MQDSESGKHINWFFVDKDGEQTGALQPCYYAEQCRMISRDLFEGRS
jgi:hypothetical protein